MAGDLNLGLHSLRSGEATAAANTGVNDRCWKHHGRWKSETSKDAYAADSLEREVGGFKTFRIIMVFQQSLQPALLCF